MKESYGEGLAAHTGPESCVTARKDRGEALTGVRAGRVLSRESNFLRGADAVRRSGRPHPKHRHREMRRDPARSQTPSMYGNTSRENREIPRAPAADDGAMGRTGKADGRTPVMHGLGKSDRPVVPEKSAKTGFWDFYQQQVERMEGRGLAKENEEEK